MKSFEFIAGICSSDCLDKYTRNLSQIDDPRSSILMYPEIRFDTPVRPLSRVEIHQLMIDSINEVVYGGDNKKHKTLIVVSHSDAVYQCFYQILKSHRVERFIFHIVDEGGNGKQHVVTFDKRRYQNLYKEIIQHE